MAIVKKHDFVEIEYTGRIKEDNTIFDTSQVVICIGENNLLKGIEEQMIGRETGREYTFELSPENAFGKKDAKLIKLIPTSKFRQQNIQPSPGLQLNIDGAFGIVKTVSGGRCLVDFNHPLASKDLVYNVKINKIVDDDKEKLTSLLKMHLHIIDAEIEFKEERVNINLKNKIPNQAQEEFKKIVGRTIPTIKNINFTITEAQSN